MTANEDDAVQVIADALHKDANAREGDAADYAFWAAAALRAAGLLPGPDDEIAMVAKLRASGYMVRRPEFPTDPPKFDDPVEIARRIGLRVAGPDDIVVSREALTTRLLSSDPHELEIANQILCAALSQPHPAQEQQT